MSFETKTCVVITCDGGCGGPWEDGIPHFDSEDQAVAYARSQEWVVTGTRALCPRCAHEADCKQTGHQWSDWRDEELHGVPFQRRWCDHCGDADYNPPYKVLRLKFQALRDAERIVFDAERAQP
ncbi:MULTISPECIES: hypothetical protein [unclassified Micromonospora]|uniref:hypothetical protein n=1 Tax=unclassified Micromonospora TaxID=2617518 RepID=UPI00331CBCA7